MSSTVARRDRLVCNSRGCYQQIEATAWVTLCSHVFCPEHGRELRERLTANPTTPCPACGSLFRDDLALLERKLNHQVQIRALQLCGYNPEVVMEIATVAIAFWNHQKQQVCANVVRKNEHYKQSVLTARKERDDAEERLRRIEVELERARAKIHELERAGDKLATTNRCNKDPISKKRREEDDFLL